MEQQNNKRIHKPRPGMDGMLSGNPRPRFGHGHQNQSGKQPVQQQRRRLDDFARPDGFRPVQQTPVSAPSQTANPTEPARPDSKIDGVIDLSLDEGPKRPKRGFLKRLWHSPRRKYFAIPAVVILIFGIVVARGIWNWNQIFTGGGGAAALQEGVDPNQLKGEGDGRVNVLLLGKGGPGHTAPDLTDTILIASIDPINNKAGLLSIPRDLWVQPQGSGYTKINAVYANAKSAAIYAGQSDKDADAAGLSAIEKTVSDRMGIPIHYHVMVDFTAFREAIDTVGGVDINVGEDGTVYEVLWDEHTGQNFTLNVQTGNQHFDGQRALFYSRSRQTSRRGDFDRTERQRLVLIALKEKIFSLGTFANPAKLDGLASTFGDHVRVNMTTDELLRLYEIGQQIDSANVSSLSLVDPPNDFLTTDNINGLSVVVPKAGLEDYDEIKSFVRNKLRDGFLAKEDAKILILNGTSVEGLAGTRSDELKSYGYNVISTATAPTQAYAQTVLVDLRGGQNKYTKHYLEKRLGVVTTDSLPDSTIDSKDADFVIIIGFNESR